MKQKQTSFRDRTAHPAIFSKAYWGGFVDNHEDAIIEARNTFVSDFRIKRPLDRPFCESLTHWGIDHLEFYKTDYGIIVVNSPYRDDLESIMADIGFNRLAYQIYSTDATTYFRRFKSVSEVKRFAKTLAESRDKDRMGYNRGSAAL